MSDIIFKNHGTPKVKSLLRLQTFMSNPKKCLKEKNTIKNALLNSLPNGTSKSFQENLKFRGSVLDTVFKIIALKSYFIFQHCITYFNHEEKFTCF